MLSTWMEPKVKLGEKPLSESESRGLMDRGRSKEICLGSLTEGKMGVLQVLPPGSQ